ncbi:hypothetical protein KDW_12390 [Dictyobacter vulcani]|uniref:Uncharacterized protein n=2 Tax=Dictyobacter vulcani TaxID=2607529 RepID=A0A5J4KL05_9CHLR|nr:hypothetical protein KDW_12390 [Dictyobacter vulcani]
MLLIIAIVFVCLLMGLAIGLWFFRRKLLPPINVKKPVSGISSWTRTLKPDGTLNANNINTLSATETENHSAATIASSAVHSPQLVLSNKTDMASNSTRTAPNLAATNANNSWYDVSDEPFSV